MNCNFSFQSHNTSLVCPAFESCWREFVVNPSLVAGRRSAYDLERALDAVSSALRQVLVDLGTRLPWVRSKRVY